MNPVLDEKATTFLVEHTIGVLSTVGFDNNPHGAVVYYLSYGEPVNIYFVTKSATSKAQNIAGHPQVAFTIFDASNAQTLQISGKAALETDDRVISYVFDNIVKPHPYAGAMLMPPVTALTDGSYVIIRIEPTQCRYSDYKQEIQANNG